MTTRHHHPAFIPATTDGLIAELQTWARGDYGLEAAVALLAAHRTWLTRGDFLDVCVIPTAARLVEEFAMPRVWLDFDAAAAVADHGTLPASEGERQILALVGELAGSLTGRSLHDLITGLDTTNLALVLDAIAHAAGWHEHRATPESPPGHHHTVTGHVGAGPAAPPAGEVGQ